MTVLRRHAAGSQVGATPTEFVFLIAFIAITITVGAYALGSALSGRFDLTSAVAENALSGVADVAEVYGADDLDG